MSDLREKVKGVVSERINDWLISDDVDHVDSITDAIAAILEDTGAPAYMRVAADLRGEKDDAG